MNSFIINILSINVVFGDYEFLLNRVLETDVRTVTCVNQYYLNLAFDDGEYLNQINNFELVHPDGIGVSLAAWFLKGIKNIPKRITGSDFYLTLLNALNERGSALFILGDNEEVLRKSVDRITKKYKQIRICGYHHGYIDLNDSNLIEIINSANPYLLFVGLGAKRQEYWINKWKNKLNVKKIIAIGGGLRVIGKDRARGPRLLQKLGLEWFVRLITNPTKMWRRYLIGIPQFILRVIFQKIHSSATK